MTITEALGAQAFLFGFMAFILFMCFLYADTPRGRRWLLRFAIGAAVLTVLSVMASIWINVLT